jgi:hypothetical protein
MTVETVRTWEISQISKVKLKGERCDYKISTGLNHVWVKTPELCNHLNFQLNHKEDPNINVRGDLRGQLTEPLHYSNEDSRLP